MKITAATDFAQQHNNGADLMTALDAAGIKSRQDWRDGATVWNFDDGSKIRISGKQIDVYGPMKNAEHVTGWAFWGWR